MIICDRCQSPACDKVTFEMDDQRFDLCASCRQVVLEVLTMKKPEPPQDMKETPTGAARKAKRGESRKP
jgi:hypothetical protein